MNPRKAPTINELAKMIDHSLLHPTMNDAEVLAGCQLSRDYNVATACVKPYSIHQALDVFAGTDVIAMRRHRLSARQQHHRH